MFPKSLLCLSLVLSLITILFQVHVSSAENNPNYGDKLVIIDKDSSELDSSRETESSSPNEDTSNNLDDDGEDGNYGVSEEHFSLLHHPDNHDIYSGRSLMSAEHIREHENRLNEDDEEEIDVEEVLKKEIGINKKSKSDNLDTLDPLQTIDFAEREWQLMFRSFDLSSDSGSVSALQDIGKYTNLFGIIVSRLKPQCQRDIYYIRDSVKKHKLWALRMLDSFGKIPSGVVYGRFASPGDYEECLSVQVDDKLYRDVAKNVTEKYAFHGKYCLLDFRLPMPKKPENKLLSIHESVLDFNNTEIGKLYPEAVGNFSTFASVFYDVGYLHAFCLPSSCDVFDLTKSITKALEGTYIIVNNTVDCEERPANQKEPLRTSQVISIALMAAVFLNASIASLAHYLLNNQDTKQPRQGRRKSSAGNNQRSHQQADRPDDKKKSKNKEKQINEDIDNRNDKRLAGKSLWSSIERLLFKNQFYADCFSVQKNFERLTKPDPRGLTFVHYTRLVAMALTVITHTGALGTLQALTKPADALNSQQIFRDLIPQVMTNAFNSIQIFFFMAGFMLVLSTYPSIARDKGRISFLEYAIKRAIRLMPGIVATICVNFIWPLLVDGPMLKYFVRLIMIPCETNWWRTLGFLSNFDHVEEMCIRHSYFSASDYQLHIIAFPILILLYKSPALALALAAILVIGGFVAQVIMVLTKTVLPFMMVDYLDKQAFINVVHYIHHPVWNHMSAFFYGFIVGYAVVKQIRFNISEKTVKRLWYIVVPAGIVSVFAPYFWNHYKRPIYRWQMVLYVIFDRLTLLTTCAWLSYASMVLARPKKPGQQSQQAGLKQVENLPPSDNESALEAKKSAITIAKFDIKDAGPEVRNQQLHPGNESPTSLPRQRSSPNLDYLQKQQQQQQQQQQQRQQIYSTNNLASPRRLVKTISSNNLETIVETSNGNNKSQFQELKDDTKVPACQSGSEPAPIKTAAGRQQQQRNRSQGAVSNLNTLCLMLSRLTFQLYLFNMVVLWIDVTHSKYNWFFSYYFIVFKGAAVYVCSALLATIFFVTLESPSLTLYIAWVKGRAAARSKQSAAREVATSGNIKQATVLNKLSGTGMIPIETLATSNADHGVGGVPAGVPKFSFIDLSSSPRDSNLAPLDGKSDQTKM